MMDIDKQLMGHQWYQIHFSRKGERSMIWTWVWAAVLWRCRLGGRKGIRPVKTERWGTGVVICLGRGADLHIAQLMPLPLTISCSSKSRLVLPSWFYISGNRLTRVVLDQMVVVLVVEQQRLYHFRNHVVSCVLLSVGLSGVILQTPYLINDSKKFYPLMTWLAVKRYAPVKLPSAERERGSQIASPPAIKWYLVFLMNLGWMLSLSVFSLLLLWKSIFGNYQLSLKVLNLAHPILHPGITAKKPIRTTAKVIVRHWYIVLLLLLAYSTSSTEAAEQISIRRRCTSKCCQQQCIWWNTRRWPLIIVRTAVLIYLHSPFNVTVSWWSGPCVLAASGAVSNNSSSFCMWTYAAFQDTWRFSSCIKEMLLIWLNIIVNVPFFLLQNI